MTRQPPTQDQKNNVKKGFPSTCTYLQYSSLSSDVFKTLRSKQVILYGPSFNRLLTSAIGIVMPSIIFFHVFKFLAVRLSISMSKANRNNNYRENLAAFEMIARLQA